VGDQVSGFGCQEGELVNPEPNPPVLECLKPEASENMFSEKSEKRSRWPRVSILIGEETALKANIES
jgi:hypothetical protein